MSWQILEFSKKFDRKEFDCGDSPLNEYLLNYISQDLKRSLSKAYVAIDASKKVVGYYTVSSARVACSEVPEKWKKQVGVYPVPCSLIGRLAVDKSMQGKGLGEELLMHAYHVIEDASKLIGIKAVIVDAENEQAEKFYLKYGFEYLQRDVSRGEKKTLFIELDNALGK